MAVDDPPNGGQTHTGPLELVPPVEPFKGLKDLLRVSRPPKRGSPSEWSIWMHYEHLPANDLTGRRAWPSRCVLRIAKNDELKTLNFKALGESAPLYYRPFYQFVLFWMTGV